jgi:hypothetical protein
VKVTGPTTPHVLSTDNNDGTYLVKFLATKSGTYLIHIQLILTTQLRSHYYYHFTTLFLLTIININLLSISVPGSPFRCLIEDKPN